MTKIGLIELHPRHRHLPPEDAAVQPLVGVDRQHGELLLVQRPEADVHDEERDEAEHARAVGGVDPLRGEDHGEVGDRRAEGHDDDDDREVVGPDEPHEHEEGEHDEPGDADADEQQPAVLRQGVGDDAGCRRQRLAAERVLDQAQGHADRRGAEAPVEADRGLQRTRDDRTEERAEVDAEIEQRESGIPSHVIGGVERADDRRRVRLQPAGADGDEHEAGREADESRQEGERDVARHDHDRAVEQHPLRAEQPVGQPRPEDRREVDRAAVRADDAGRDALVDAESALADGVVHVDEQDALHAVEAEPLPHLHAEDVRQRERLAEEPGVVVADLVLGLPVAAGRRTDGDLRGLTAACAAHGVRLVLSGAARGDSRAGRGCSG